MDSECAEPYQFESSSVDSRGCESVTGEVEDKQFWLVNHDGLVSVPAGTTTTSGRTLPTASGWKCCLASLRITITGVHTAASAGPLPLFFVL